MDKNRLGIMEYRFLTLIWENEPIGSMQLVEKCREAFDWKKSTTFTMLRKLQEKGLVENENSVVASLVARKDVEQAESDLFLDQTFSGSLPNFLTAFFNGKTISEEEAEELKTLIDSFKG